MNSWQIIFILICFAIMIVFVGCVDHPSMRTIQFSGHDWWVKSNVTPAGPGPNFFSDSSNNVWIDEKGRLHMKITQNGDRWESAEIVSNESFGYGEYVFTLASDPESLDPEIVLGLFTWDDKPDYSHREIDIEFSRWEILNNLNSQNVVQPWNYPGNIDRFDVRANGATTTHSFTWQPDGITFKSYFGPYSSQPDQNNLINTWEYKGKNNPLPGQENARINLWLVNGRHPTNGKESEIIIEQFKFIP